MVYSAYPFHIVDRNRNKNSISTLENEILCHNFIWLSWNFFSGIVKIKHYSESLITAIKQIGNIRGCEKKIYDFSANIFFQILQKCLIIQKLYKPQLSYLYLMFIIGAKNNRIKLNSSIQVVKYVYFYHTTFLRSL